MSFLDAAPRLAAVSRPVSYASGARLVRQGEAARGAFVIERGRVEARVALPGGGMLTVAELAAGDMFGEMALVERGVCSATVSAATDVQAWFIERDDFCALVASRDAGALELQRAITRVLAAKLRALNVKVREQRSAEDRPLHRPPDSIALPEKEPEFDWRAFLPRLSFFEGFDAAEMAAVASLGRARDVPAGAWLFVANGAADRCFLIVRGAVEIVAPLGRMEKRVALAGPGELVGYLAALDGAPHTASARVRTRACLLDIPSPELARLYEGDAAASVKLQRAIHVSLLRALTRTNTVLTRLISHALLADAAKQAVELETALYGQLWRATETVNSS